MAVMQRLYYNDGLYWQPKDRSGIPDVAPSAPLSLTATVLAWDQIRLNWAQPTTKGDLETFEIRYAAGATAPATATDGILAGRVSSATVTFTVTGLTASTQYSFSVFGRTPQAVYGPKASVTATTSAAIPSAPGSFSAVTATNSTSQINLNWTAAAQPAAMNEWEVRWAQGSTAPATVTDGTLLARYPVATITASHTGRTQGTQYAYSIWGRTPEGLYGPKLSDSDTTFYQTVAAISGGKTINRGDSATLTATMTGPTSGSVRFRSGSGTGTIVATDTTSPWTASVAPTSTTTYYSEYVASGIYLGDVSNSGTTVTVLQKTYAVVTSADRCSGCWAWKQSSEPIDVSTTFSMPRQGYVYQFRIQAQGYYGNNSGNQAYYAPYIDNTHLANQTVAEAAGSDTGWSQMFAVSNLNLAAGTHTVGFIRNTSFGTQWDYRSSSDTESIVYEIDYWYWA